MSPDVVSHIAQRYVVSEEAVRELFRALESTGGKQAQFNHPDLGGRGQWMPGMIMMSDRHDAQTKARIVGLCAEVSAIVQGRPTSSDKALAAPMDAGASAAYINLPAGESWWPAAFGHPSATGDQHGIRYAYFPDRDRLLVQQGARITSYDTSGQRITGFAQHQSTASHICFTTERGAVALSDLACVPITARAD
jgi:hypothetical protein